MLRVGLALDARIEGEVLATMLDLGHRVAWRCHDDAGPHDWISTGTAVDVLLVSAGAKGLSAELIDAADAAGTRVVALANGEGDRRRAVALGLLDVVVLPVTPEDLDRVVAPLTVDEAVTGSRPSPEGRVIAVWGAGGAPGATTIATAIASELAAAGRRVLLVDADTYGASIAPMLGLLDEAPGFAAACRLAGGGALDDEQLERISVMHPSPSGAFRVLTGISRSARWPELSAERVTATLERCRRWVDDVVVDTAFCIEADEEIASDLFAPRRNGAAFAVLAAAEYIVEIGSADPVGMTRLLRGHAELIELVDPERISVIVNRLRSVAVGTVPAAQLTSTLSRFGGIEAAALFPEDQRAVDAAVISGSCLRDHAPRAPLALAVRRFVATTFLVDPSGSQATTRRDARAARRRERFGLVSGSRERSALK